MVAPQPNTSYATDSLLFKDENDELEGYGKETFTLLKYVFHEMKKDEQKPTIEEELPLERAQRYTGFPINTLETLMHSDVPIDKIKEIDRKCVHDALMSFYLEKHIVPTATELFQNLQDSLQHYEDIRSFRKKLVKMGYIFKKKSDCFVVYEKPLIRFERFLYLINITQYRQNNKPIYFLSELDMSNDMVRHVDQCKFGKSDKPILYYFAVSSLKGVEFLKHVMQFDKDNFNKWLLNDVIPYLETNSVVILSKKDHCSDTFLKTPKKTCPRHVMTDWLTHHEIPFNDAMSTVELYTLVEKYNHVYTTLYKVNLWLKQNGHQILRLPNCINELTPAAHVRELINKNLECKEILLTENIEDIANAINKTELNCYNLMLAKEETRLYDLEIKLDNVLDTLNPSFFMEKDLYLPSLSDSD